ncbi:hypothetical protein BKK79_32285 [Cupriavidus sp. USMAA2-4]|uniref:Uncharacterized protein n=1 Tax=Cupriavidus malaysiensis TaxID=367825 RepID=A0ABM6FC40_9BURK|nr:MULTISPECIES: hypothetical protein [Cupriavidus]AOY96281.1 hypothetical protein BKK79_32285 [Cupriavidus sp. USMAA2-4]AOZ03318.1 hypothetical protein BKK81_29955 [Cupriavidus sp. USMAHM13]AOZ09321.1 hypothetical protein BKK80_26400 [Cupriavidus malaysiensis]
MPAFLATSILLEADFLPGDRETVRLPCTTVVVHDGAISVRGVETWRIDALRWQPDSLSFESGGECHRYRVGRPSLGGALTARFPLRAALGAPG